MEPVIMNLGAEPRTVTVRFYGSRNEFIESVTVTAAGPTEVPVPDGAASFVTEWPQGAGDV